VTNTWNLDPNQLFDPQPPRRPVARKLYDWVANLITTCLVDEEDTPEMVHEPVDDLAREAYLPVEQPVRSAR
jgi:hypothetical protein